MPQAADLPIDTSATALDMAAAMFGNGIAIETASYSGAASASGIYSNGDTTAPDITPSDTGVILSTGTATDVTNSGGDVNSSASTTTKHGTTGDDDLQDISGQATYDAAIFEATFVPDGSVLTMQVVFSSEEYLEYVDSGFNDAVGIWVNGAQAELTVGSGDISIDNINDGSNQNLYVDNARSDDTYNTEMDGFTITLTLKAPVRPGEVNSIKIGIADAGDNSLDSNLLIAGNSVQTALIAGDDAATVNLGSDVDIDVLANDTSSSGSALTITHINGQPVVVGSTVTLASGQAITLTADGFTASALGAAEGDSVFTYTVADEDGNSDIGFVTLTTTPCFTAGTLIATPDGSKVIERLRPGDLVQTLDHGAQPLLWIGRSVRPAQGMTAPIEIATGVLGAQCATRVSPQHRLLIHDAGAALLFGSGQILVKAQHLVDGRRIRRRQAAGLVTYFHLLFRRHEIIFGNGVASESFQPGQRTLASFDPRAAASLARAMRLHGLQTMPSARPSLKKYEVAALKVGSVMARV